MNDFERLKQLTNEGTSLVNRKTADDGITKSNQLKCIIDVQFHIIHVKISCKFKEGHFTKNIY